MKFCYVKNQGTRTKYWKAYIEGVKAKEDQILIKIAKEERIAPCLIAKLILVEYLERIIKVKQEENVSSIVNKFLKNSNLIPDASLAYEVWCVGILLY